MFRWFKKRFQIPDNSGNKKPENQYSKLEKILGFGVSKEEEGIYHKALRHRSKVDGKRFEKFDSYERLEFLGDSVLDLIVTEILYEKFPSETEGFLTKLRARVVRGETLAELSGKIGLDELIQIGERAQGQGIEYSKSVLADVFEAIIAAIYLTKGYKASFDFVSETLNKHLDFSQLVKQNDNYKSILLEYTQAEKMSLPEYNIISEYGPGHNKTFSVSVSVNGAVCGKGKGKSKKQAEQKAAKNAIKKFRDQAESEKI